MSLELVTKAVGIKKQIIRRSIILKECNLHPSKILIQSPIHSPKQPKVNHPSSHPYPQTYLQTFHPSPPHSPQTCLQTYTTNPLSRCLTNSSHREPSPRIPAVYQNFSEEPLEVANKLGRLSMPMEVVQDRDLWVLPLQGRVLTDLQEWEQGSSLGLLRLTQLHQWQ